MARWWYASLILLFWYSCALFGKPPEPCEQVPLELFVKGAQMLNMNAEGQSMPVEVRAYFLTGRDKIEVLDFDSVHQRAKEALGETLVKSTSFTVVPGEEKITTVSVPLTTQYVAFVGLFRLVEGEQWRRIVDIKSVVARCKPGDLHAQISAQVRDNRVVAQESVE